MLKTISPIDNSLYVEIPYASESTIEYTLTSSHKAKTEWKNTSLQERKKLIEKFVESFLSNNKEIEEELSRQMGRPISQCAGELRGFEEIVDLLDIFHILNKYPHQISAGEAQRASLARSLITQPDLLLLDEPLSNVDQSFKEEIQVRLKKILNQLKITTIIVTHDSYEAFYLGSKCGIIINQELKQFDDPYKVYHFPNSVEVVNFLNRGILIPAKVTGENTLESWDLGTIEGNFIKHYPKGANVQLLLQPEDLEHDDKSNLKLEVVDRKFRGTNFIYTLKTPSDTLIPVFVHSHHIHQHEVDEKFGIKRPIHIDHIVCF